jgi:hypothetical protein
MMIGLSGWARSGKDTVAGYLVEKHGFVRVSFADQMRTALYNLDPSIDLDGYRISLRSAVDLMGWENLKSQSADVRGLMQRMGTEVGRNLWGDDFWVEAAMKSMPLDANVVFSDVRYPNEANAIRRSGGQVWRISRDGVGPANDHDSETSLNTYNFDQYVLNNASIEATLAYVESLFDK